MMSISSRLNRLKILNSHGVLQPLKRHDVQSAKHSTHSLDTAIYDTDRLKAKPEQEARACFGPIADDRRFSEQASRSRQLQQSLPCLMALLPPPAVRLRPGAAMVESNPRSLQQQRNTELQDRAQHPMRLLL